ncbi:MAG: hypothetical protein Q8M76_05470, partial [Spirochaetaceae bacterium]|nr:hypothetical protein [Spirochaetaceae bacterium]
MIRIADTSLAGNILISAAALRYSNPRELSKMTYAESRGLVSIGVEVEGVFVDLGYAKERNFFGRRLYD